MKRISLGSVALSTLLGFGGASLANATVLTSPGNSGTGVADSSQAANIISSTGPSSGPILDYNALHVLLIPDAQTRCNASAPDCFSKTSMDFALYTIESVTRNLTSGSTGCGDCWDTPDALVDKSVVATSSVAEPAAPGKTATLTADLTQGPTANGAAQPAADSDVQQTVQMDSTSSGVEQTVQMDTTSSDLELTVQIDATSSGVVNNDLDDLVNSDLVDDIFDIIVDSNTDQTGLDEAPDGDIILTVVNDMVQTETIDNIISDEAVVGTVDNPLILTNDGTHNNNGNSFDQVTQVPTPSALALIGVGLLGMRLARKRTA